MYHRTCSDCLCYDLCAGCEVCKEFYPANDNEGETDFIIEQGRDEFKKEWNQYLSEDSKKNVTDILKNIRRINN